LNNSSPIACATLLVEKNKPDEIANLQ